MALCSVHACGFRQRLTLLAPPAHPPAVGGFGLFATEPIKAGSFIIEYVWESKEEESTCDGRSSN
jgi:hypothetical protein